MGYYKEYIVEKAKRAFDYEIAECTLYDKDHERVEGCLDDELNEQMFNGVMREMVAYLYELRNDAESGASIEMLVDPDNVENIYLSARGLATPVVIVEYEDKPEWFSMRNADLREFYWFPKPALSGEWDAAYFQPR